MRGKLRYEGIEQLLDRITPADAGKTSTNNAYCSRYRDHPRGCGENRYSCSRRRSRRGSPPRMRGKLAVRPLGRHQERITPADAGKTSDSNAVYGASKDHPRGCGENNNPQSKTQNRAGSPPRMRGKRICFSVRAQQTGITPADAGKTFTAAKRTRFEQDHPRGCGENKEKEERD